MAVDGAEAVEVDFKEINQAKVMELLKVRSKGTQDEREGINNENRRVDC